MRISIEINQPHWLASRPRLRKGIFVAAILGLFVIPGTVIASHQFADVPDSQPFHTEIGWMKDNAITQGSTECGTPPPGQEFYCPESNVRRDAMAAFLFRVSHNQVVDAGKLEGKSLSDLDARYAPAGSGGSGWSLTGNSATTPGTNFLGTTDNTALEVKVNNRRVLRVEPATRPNLVGGDAGNTMTAGVMGGAISGGGGNDTDWGFSTSVARPNLVRDHFGTIGGGLGNLVGGGFSSVDDAWGATVGGGYRNQATGLHSTVGGGEDNVANGDSTTIGGGSSNRATLGAADATVAGGASNEARAAFATVGGGDSNIASGVVATVAGGDSNSASGGWATVAGGINNTASGSASVVAGGWNNAATGDYSLAAGRHASADDEGAFVWGDSQCCTQAFSPGANTFTVRAAGGIWLGNVNPDASSMPTEVFIHTSTGAHLTTGGMWTNSSDMSAKTTFSPVDPKSVLDAVANMPITTWSYRAEDPSIRHLGPTAQDFAAAFGLGADDTSIGTVDADGVALAAIQGLHAEVESLKKQLEHQSTPDSGFPTWALLTATAALSLGIGRRWGLGAN